MSIATKTGDAGMSSLMFGRRISKTDARLVAVGACDELNAALGMARAFSDESLITEAVLGIQKELVILMGELAVAIEDRGAYAGKGFAFVEAAMTERLTAQIDHLEQHHQISYKHWATPGATQGSACLDLARTACRRAERAVVALQERELLPNAEIIRYLNRLSDLCWLWARFVESSRPSPFTSATAPRLPKNPPVTPRSRRKPLVPSKSATENLGANWPSLPKTT